jgi:hypothetical protein
MEFCSQDSLNMYYIVIHLNVYILHTHTRILYMHTITPPLLVPVFQHICFGNDSFQNNLISCRVRLFDKHFCVQHIPSVFGLYNHIISLKIPQKVAAYIRLPYTYA